MKVAAPGLFSRVSVLGIFNAFEYLWGKELALGLCSAVVRATEFVVDPVYWYRQCQ